MDGILAGLDVRRRTGGGRLLRPRRAVVVISTPVVLMLAAWLAGVWLVERARGMR